MIDELKFSPNMDLFVELFVSPFVSYHIWRYKEMKFLYNV